MLSLGSELLASIESTAQHRGGSGPSSKGTAASPGLQRNDVVLSMALAYCGFADQLLTNQEVGGGF